MNYRMITYILGWILLFEAAFLLLPLLVGVIYGESAWLSFLWSALILAATGGLLVMKKPKSKELRSRDGFVVVSLSWIVLALFGALPFMLTGVTTSFFDAFFETVSGFTTTGSTIFSDVESLPRAILFWRAFTHWIGGMGVLVFLMAFLPLSGGQNMHIMKAESPGPSVSKLVPRVRTTALLLYTIYFVLTLIEFVLLLCGEMDGFEALCTAFSTAGTGGFGVKNDSINGFSAYTQTVVAIFMLLFGINFSSYFLVIRAKFKEAFTTEVRTFLVIVAVAVTLVTLSITAQIAADPALQAQLGSSKNLGDIIRHAFFAVSSIISTTGFVTVDFDLWPQLARSILVLLMFTGCCAGSTGGGIKVSRIVIYFKCMMRELRLAVHPKQVRHITVDGKPVEESVVRSSLVFLGCFVSVFAISTLVVSLDCRDFTTNFTAVAATMGNIGPGLNAVGPTCNFGFFSPLSKLVLSFCMLAGRLELIPMLLLFSPTTWKK